VRLRALCFAAVASFGCSHTQLSSADLDRVAKPAYVAYVAESAGPHAQAPGGDKAPTQAQLVAAMNTAINKFEVSERLRSQVASALRAEKPFSNAVPAAQVASVLETFLVEREPPVPPDYTRLKPTGADAVLELVVDEYGLQPTGGGSQPYLRGHARLFLLADGTELWRTDFQRSGSVQRLPALDIVTLSPDAAPYGDQMRAILDAQALALAQELSPPGRPGSQPLSTPALQPVPAEKPADTSGTTRPLAPDLTPPAQTPAPTNRLAPKTPPPPDLTPPTEQPVTPKQP
jgi:hypothetical protein